MRSPLIAIAALLLAGCGQGAPNPYPESARVSFNATCPADEPFCTCFWDRVTRTMTHEEYEAAMQRYSETGLMEPKVTRARLQCRERHPTETR